MANQVQQYTHKQYFKAPNIQKTFDDVWKGAGTQFATSVLSVIQGSYQLQKATNESIMAAAMKAAVLNLPIEPSLGYAYIVPYKQQAQFQLGYKGLIQLAQRSGKYKNINAGVVYKAQLVGYNPLSGDLDIDFTKPKDEVIGYFAYFKLLNGFEKVTYWTKEEAEAHGKRFSKTFNNGPWKTDFDAMAIKTALKDIISKYGPLSIEMQDAISEDNEDSTVNNEAKDVTPEDNGIADLIGAPEQTSESQSVPKEMAEGNTMAQSQTVPEEATAPNDAPHHSQEKGTVTASEGNLFDNINDLV